MQENELQITLKQAQLSVQHFTDIVNTYETQIERFKIKAERSIEGIKSLNNVMRHAVQGLEIETELFKDAIEDWIEDQIVDTCIQFFTVMIDFASAFEEGGVDPGKILSRCVSSIGSVILKCM